MASGNKNKRFRWWALKLTIITVVVFALQLFISGFTELFVLDSAKAFTAPWRLITSIFLHGGIVHLAYNMFALALFGLILEKKIGTRNFLLVYFIGGILANIATLPFYTSSLGASGAIFAVIGMLATVRPKMIVWVYYIPMRMWLAAIVWTIGNVFLVFVPDSGIGAIAHISGVIFGVIAGFWWRAFRGGSSN